MIVSFRMTTNAATSRVPMIRRGRAPAACPRGSRVRSVVDVTVSDLRLQRVLAGASASSPVAVNMTPRGARNSSQLARQSARSTLRAATRDSRQPGFGVRPWRTPRIAPISLGSPKIGRVAVTSTELTPSAGRDRRRGRRAQRVAARTPRLARRTAGWTHCADVDADFLAAWEDRIEDYVPGGTAGPTR